jgi:hypothetical protein
LIVVGAIFEIGGVAAVVRDVRASKRFLAFLPTPGLARSPDSPPRTMTCSPSKVTLVGLLSGPRLGRLGASGLREHLEAV